MIFRNRDRVWHPVYGYGNIDDCSYPTPPEQVFDTALSSGWIVNVFFDSGTSLGVNINELNPDPTVASNITTIDGSSIANAISDGMSNITISGGETIVDLSPLQETLREIADRLPEKPKEKEPVQIKDFNNEDLLFIL